MENFGLWYVLLCSICTVGMYVSFIKNAVVTCLYCDLIIISIFLQVMFYALAVITFGTAVPAGQFVPGIMIGSTYGRLVGMFVVKYYRRLNIEEGT